MSAVLGRLTSFTVAALVLGACSGGDDDGAAEPTATEATTTTTEPTATPEQVAGNIAGVRDDWLEAYEQTSLDCFILDQACTESPAAVLGYLTLATVTETLDITLDTITLPDAPRVPAEMEDLVAGTVTAVDDLLPRLGVGVEPQRSS